MKTKNTEAAKTKEHEVPVGTVALSVSDAKPLTPREQLTNAVDQLNALVADYNKSEAALVRAIDRAKQKHEGALVPLREDIRVHREEIEAFAKEHQDELLTGKTKTLKLPAGTIAFRTTGASIKVDDEDAAIASLKERGLGEHLVRTVEEVNKKALGARDDRDAIATATPGLTLKPSTTKATVKVNAEG